MKKAVCLALVFALLLSFFACGKKAGPETFETAQQSVETLKEKYPEYFELSDFKGIEVYVWQMGENVYRCGLMSGTNRNKTDEEILSLAFKSLTVDEAKSILAELGVENDRVIAIPIVQPTSSYLYEIDDDYRERVRKLFE